MYSVCMGTTKTTTRLALALAFFMALASIGTLPRLTQATNLTTTIITATR